jgi:hypothetical protein
MNVRRSRAARSGNQSGYALILVVALATLLLISTMVVAPNILTEGRREKEKEMIWRGKQYARGVKLYYRKLGRFPTSLDDLTKPKVGSLRFMRQAYKDPMNKQDGTWRFIYVGPAGQLIGSLKPPQQNLLFPQAAAAGTPVSATNGPAATPQPGMNGPPPQPGSQPGQTTPGATPTGTTGAPVSADQGDGSLPQGVPAGDTPNIIGGNIIGVGSKINQRSVIIYEKAKNYRLFEFIWDPSKDNIGVGQPGVQTGTGLGQTPIGQPIGQPPGQNPVNPQPNQPQNPPQPPQNPQQQ